MPWPNCFCRFIAPLMQGRRTSILTCSSCSYVVKRYLLNCQPCVVDLLPIACSCPSNRCSWGNRACVSNSLFITSSSLCILISFFHFSGVCLIFRRTVFFRWHSSDQSFIIVSCIHGYQSAYGMVINCGDCLVVFFLLLCQFAHHPQCTVARHLQQTDIFTFCQSVMNIFLQPLDKRVFINWVL